MTRTWQGTGGLQRLSRDLWQEMEKAYGHEAAVCHPSRLGLLALVSFAVRALVQGIRAGRSTHIHLGDASLSPLGALMSAITGAKVSVTVAGLDVIYGAWWYQPLIRWSLPRLHRVCSISRATEQEVLKRGVLPERSVVIPCGIHTAHLPSRVSVSHEVPRLISVCRLVPRKGIAWFIEEVMPLLLADMPSLQYSVIGEGPEMSRIAQSIHARGLVSSVHLLGNCDDVARDTALIDADLLVVPNVHIAGDMEGFGIVCIEASARGVPVAAAHIEGVADAVLERETGRFFESGNAADAARVIRQMIAVPFDPLEIEQATALQYDWVRLFPLYHDAVFQ